MELKIKCDAKVDLNGFVNLMDVSCEISKYELVDDTLSGDVCVKGNYIKDDLKTKYDFEENVPFTVVFKEKNYSINSIEIDGLQTTEIINHGIECKFDIKLDYDEVVSLEETNDESLVEVDLDQKIKEDILKNYDDVLSELLNIRDDIEELEDAINSLDDKVDDNSEEKERNVRILDTKEKLKSWIDMIPSTFLSYRVFYPQKESEIDVICQKENISLDKIYKDNVNKDFASKKRIIVK